MPWDPDGPASLTLKNLATRPVHDEYWSYFSNHIADFAAKGHRAVLVSFVFSPVYELFAVRLAHLNLAAPPDLLERCRAAGIQVEEVSRVEFILRWAPPICHEKCVTWGELGCGGDATGNENRCDICGRGVVLKCNIGRASKRRHPLCAEE